MQNMVSWKDYQGIGGFGVGPSFSPDDLDYLNKALTAGSDVNSPGVNLPGNGFALRVESLEATLKNLTSRMEHIRLWKAIPKKPAYNTIEEHNEITSYGQDIEGFVAAGQLPPVSDATYNRRNATIKYLGTTRVVDHPMSLIRPAHGNVIANETVAGTMHLLRMLERSLFFARSDLSELQFDGYEALIQDNAPSDNVIDMRGQPLSEPKLIDGALTISDQPNYGIPTHLHCNPKVKADLAKSFFPKGRYDIGDKLSDGMIGLDLKGFTSPAGDIMFEPNTFLHDGGAPPSSTAGDESRIPASPVISTAATTPVEATTQFDDDWEGSYYYSISAHNDYGHSAAVAVDASAIAVASGDKVTFGVTPGSSKSVKWYQLYRSEKDGSSSRLRLIARIPNTAGLGELTVNDLNAKIPFTTSAFLWQQNDDCLAWKQLCPFIKIPLGTTGPNISWMQLCYGVPVLYAPGRTVLYTNIGRSPGYVGQP